MNWFKKTLSMIALLNTAMGPLAQAADSNQKAVANMQALSQPVNGITYSYQIHNNSAWIYQQNVTKAMMQVEFTSPAELRKYSPKNIDKQLAAEMARVRSMSGAMKGAWSHSVKSLPLESAMFAGVMFAVAMGTSGSLNPIAQFQSIEHSASPMGTLGFFSFMYSQGVTSNMLQMYLRDPKYAYMIPYLGMFVGGFVQQYLTAFLSDPNVVTCAKSWFQRKDAANAVSKEEGMESCEKAYEYIVVNKKIWEFAPGLTSMLLSSMAAGIGQEAIKRGAVGLATNSVFKVKTAMNVALWLTPGALEVKGMRMLLVKGLQLYAFVQLDQLFARSVTYAWKNMVDGAAFWDQNDRLNDTYNTLQAKGWANDDKKITDLVKEIKNVRAKMSDWRMMNLSEVYEAHQNWTTALEQMISMYNASYKFYETTVGEIRKVRFNEKGAQVLAALTPLAGIKAKGLADGHEDKYLYNANFVLHMQMETVKDAAAKILAYTADPNSEAAIYSVDKKKLEKIAQALNSDDVQIILGGLRAFEKYRDEVFANTLASMEIGRFIVETWNDLGDPVLPTGLGQAYTSIYPKVPSTQESGINKVGYYRITGAFQTPKVTDHLLMQMICGPDAEKGGVVIRKSQGFPSVFTPPQIATASADSFACGNVGMNLPVDQIYSREMDFNGKTYQGVVPYLIEAARPQVIGNADQSNFDQWWKQNTDSQVEAAFDVYGRSYETIIVKMIKGIWSEGRSILNGHPPLSNPWTDFKNMFSADGGRKAMLRKSLGGPIFNGGLNSAIQEAHIYMSILDAIRNPNFKLDIAFENTLEWKPLDVNLKNVDAELNNLKSLLRRLQVKTVTRAVKGDRDAAPKTETVEVVTGSLENSELEAQAQKVQEALKTFTDSIGYKDESQGSSLPEPGDGTVASESPSCKMPQKCAVPAVPTLTAAHNQVIKAVVEQLNSLVMEIMMYGSIANAVNWSKIQNLKGISEQQAQFKKAQAEALQQMQRAKGISGQN